MWFLYWVIAIIIAYVIGWYLEEDGKNGICNQIAKSVVTAAILSPIYFQYPNHLFSKVVGIENAVVTDYPLGKFCLWNCYNVVTREIRIAVQTPVAMDACTGARTRLHLIAYIKDPVRYFQSALPKHWMSASPFNSGEYKQSIKYPEPYNDEEEIVRLVFKLLPAIKTKANEERIALEHSADTSEEELKARLIELKLKHKLSNYGIGVYLERFEVE